MKHLPILAIGLVAFFFDTPIIKAQDAAPAPVVVVPTAATYTVLDITRINLGRNQDPAQTLEAILNELAAEGWRVVTTAGSFIILSK